MDTLFNNDNERRACEVRYRTDRLQSPETQGNRMQRPNDRRRVRTRKNLSDALVALILRKGYDAITVQDIIDEAEVGRSTFYMHYAGKEDLLRASFETLRAELAEPALTQRGKRAEPLPFSLALFEHACAHKHIYRALDGGRGGVVVGKQIRVVLADVVRKELAKEPDDGIPAEIRVQFVVDAFLAVLSWSLGRKPALPPPRMDAIFRRLALHGLSARTS
jgi:AcrR family transcriptional regulator